MKKTVFTLLIFMVCTIQAMAYEYFTIYFIDGTKSEAFYATDVDSICYSKLSLDGIAFDEWQVQEIYTCDSVYRYPLAQIDSLSFKDVDVNKVAEDIARVNNLIVPLYLQCESISQLTEHLSTIQNSAEVEDAWTDNQSLFVKIRDYGTISFMYPPALVPLDAQYEGYRLPSKRAASQESNAHNHVDVQKICVYNQTINDESPFFDAAAEACDIICGMNNVMGISCDPFTNLTPKFFQEEIFNYDQIFLITHGEYDQKHNLHWLLTSEELLCVEKEDMLSNISAGSHLLTKYPFYSPYLIGCTAHKEIRNGKPCVVYYTKISEKFISASPNRFKQFGNAMIFNAACQSLKGNNNMAKAFIDKGAGCYIGYNETNDIGHGGAQEFCAGMLNGSSVQGSYNCIPSKWKEEIYEVNNACYPVELKIIKSSEKITNSCIVDIETLEPDKENANVKLQGRIKMLNTSVADNYKYGFQYSTNYEMSQPQNINAEGNHDNSTLYMNWEKTLDTSTLSPNTTYYYRAYMNDGYSDCYGEIKKFSVNDNDDEDSSSYKAYFILNDGTATFYYDDKFEERGDEVFSVESYLDPYWHHLYYDDIYKIVFDISFSKYKPTNTNIKYFFYRCSKLKEIVNIRFLNTSNATSMYEMFLGCESLTTLDLSSFNTSKVEDMSYMFFNCYSLKTINFGNFNTSNVKWMDYMFGYCKSLTSLDLSSFNTKNVYNMSFMFVSCHSLTDIVLSSFNTENVIDMFCIFNDCRSLKSIDVSGFNTSAVTDMGGMFANCSSLISLNLSNFHTGQVRKMGGMFVNCSSLISVDLSSFEIYNPSDAMGVNLSSMFKDCLSLKTIYAGNWNHYGENMFQNCNNLEGGQGTKLGYNIYGYDSQGSPLGYWCDDNFKAAHIDGGKDNPGLFTAK